MARGAAGHDVRGPCGEVEAENKTAVWDMVGDAGSACLSSSDIYSAVGVEVNLEAAGRRMRRVCCANVVRRSSLVPNPSQDQEGNEDKNWCGKLSVVGNTETGRAREDVNIQERTVELLHEFPVLTSEIRKR